jgi:SAM-dependent methyltransferase
MVRLRQELAAQRTRDAEPPGLADREPIPARPEPPASLWGRLVYRVRRYWELPAELEALERKVDEQAKLLAEAQKALLSRLVRLEGDMRFEHRRLARLADHLAMSSPAMSSPPATASPSARTIAELRDLPLEGEDARTRRLSAHLERVRGWPSLGPAHPLLDIGCKTGEWVALLNDAGIQAYGVDIDPQPVEQAGTRGVHAQVADGIEHLSRLPDGSLGAVSALRLLEYLPIEQVGALIAEARRCLVAGGLLLIETPNADSLMVTVHTFAEDPRRTRALPRAVLRLLLEGNGFRIEKELPEPRQGVEESAGVSVLDEPSGSPPDMTMIARKL